MTAPLLTTKLYIPPPRPRVVPRSRLIQRLDEGPRLGRKLTLVSAPAGFGKTTLLSEWAHDSEQPLAWLSLDNGDNDPARFWAYLVAALQTVQADLGVGVLELLRSPQPPPAEAVLTALVNEIASGPSFALVLDDYHVIEAQPIHDVLSFLLEHLPPQVHLVIATRVDPPLPLARLRARGQATELREADLRFTPDEAAAFLNQVMGLSLSQKDVTALESRTEGWIAGLQMAALSMQEREEGDRSEFVASFAGSHRYILDYLTEEVLHWQPKDVQSFLLETAILDRLTGPLCDAVTGRKDGREVLERLDEANLFIVPLDDERYWYRYHQLFGELLRNQLVRLQPDRLPILHRRASAWYEQNGLLAAAVSHALAADDVERAASLIKAAAAATIHRGEFGTLSGWLAALPEAAIRSRPWLCLFHAWTQVFSGNLELVEARLQDAERAVGEHEGHPIAGYVAAIRANVAFLQGAVPRAIGFARQALGQLPATDPTVRGSTALILGATLALSGDLAAAAPVLTEAQTIGETSGNTHLAILAGAGRAQIEATRGRLHETVTMYRSLLRGEEKRVPAIGSAHLGLADVLREWNDLEAAEHHAREGIELCRQWGQVEVLINGYIVLARVQWARGDAAGAVTTLEEGVQIARTRFAWPGWVIAYRARLWLAQGDLQAAARWARESGLSADDELHFQREIDYLTLARVLIAQGELEDAARLLARLLQAAEAAGRTGGIVEILVLQALVRQAQGEVEQALTTLERALSLAEPEGYVRVFLDEGEPIVELLRQALSRGMAPGYASELLSAPDVWEYESREEGHPHPRPHPLSDRELEVLRLIAAGLSNREIAERLYVSINTVKAHTKSIYGKLDVHNRTQAAAQARELKLL